MEELVKDVVSGTLLERGAFLLPIKDIFLPVTDVIKPHVAFHPLVKHSVKLK